MNKKGLSPVIGMVFVLLVMLVVMIPIAYLITATPAKYNQASASVQPIFNNAEEQMKEVNSPSSPVGFYYDNSSGKAYIVYFGTPPVSINISYFLVYTNNQIKNISINNVKSYSTTYNGYPAIVYSIGSGYKLVAMVTTLGNIIYANPYSDQGSGFPPSNSNYVVFSSPSPIYALVWGLKNNETMYAGYWVPSLRFSHGVPYGSIVRPVNPYPPAYFPIPGDFNAPRWGFSTLLPANWAGSHYKDAIAVIPVINNGNMKIKVNFVFLSSPPSNTNPNDIVGEIYLDTGIVSIPPRPLPLIGYVFNDSAVIGITVAGSYSPITWIYFFTLGNQTYLAAVHVEFMSVLGYWQTSVKIIPIPFSKTGSIEFQLVPGPGGRTIAIVSPLYDILLTGINVPAGSNIAIIFGKGLGLTSIEVTS